MFDFLWLMDVNAGGLRLKKGQGKLHLTHQSPLLPSLTVIQASRNFPPQRNEEMEHETLEGFWPDSLLDVCSRIMGPADS